MLVEHVDPAPPSRATSSSSAKAFVRRWPPASAVVCASSSRAWGRRIALGGPPGGSSAGPDLKTRPSRIASFVASREYAVRARGERPRAPSTFLGLERRRQHVAIPVPAVPLVDARRARRLIRSSVRGLRRVVGGGRGRRPCHRDPSEAIDVVPSSAVVGPDQLHDEMTSDADAEHDGPAIAEAPSAAACGKRVAPDSDCHAASRRSPRAVGVRPAAVAQRDLRPDAGAVIGPSIDYQDSAKLVDENTPRTATCARFAASITLRAR